MRRFAVAFSFLFGLILVFVIGCQGCSKEVKKIKFGEKVAKIKLKTAAGKSVDLSKLSGAHLIVFWAPGEKASAAMLDELEKTLKSSRLKKIKVLAVSRGKDKKDKQKAEKDFAKNKWPFTSVYDPDLKSAKHFGVGRPLPVLYIIGKNHRLKSVPMRDITSRIRSLSFPDMLALALDGKNIPRVDFVLVTGDEKGNIGLVSKKPPPFTVKTLQGYSYTPTQFKGRKNLIIVFWSPHCPHCKKELPEIRKFISKYGEKLDVEVLTIAQGKGSEDKAFLQKTMANIVVDFPTAMVSSGDISKKYFATTVPTLYAINKNGVICEYLKGQQKDTVEILKSIFEDPKRMGMK